jgi:hypothetical protein
VRALRQFRLALVATAVVASGCSLIFVREAPGHETTEAPECTSSAAAPVADSLLAFATTALALAALDATRQCRAQGDCGESAGPSVLVLAGIASAGTIASTVYGFRQTSHCRDAVAAWCSSHDCGPFAAEPSQ